MNKEYRTNIKNNENVILLSIDSIKQFHSYPFQLYHGEQLENMIESIKEDGIRFPVIVQKIENGYEMLSGHNRQRAAKIIGLTQIPAIIKENLSEEEAYTYIIESNMIQRVFADLLVSEKALIIEWRYKKIFHEPWYKNIIQELEKIHNKNLSRYNDQIRGRYDISSTYGFSERNAVRYLRLNYLIPHLKKLVDQNKLTFLAALEVSYMTIEEQEWIYNAIVYQGLKLSILTAKELRKQSGAILKDMLAQSVDIVFEYECSLKEGLILKLPKTMCEKYLSGMSAEEIQSLMEQALEKWFEEK